MIIDQPLTLARVVLLASIASLPTLTNAQSWRFEEASENKGQLVFGSGEPNALFMCQQSETGVEIDDVNYEFTLLSPELVSATGTSPGVLTQITLGIDGATLGAAPFLHNDEGRLVVSLPARHALVGSFKDATNATFSAGDEANRVALEVSFDQAKAGFAELEQFCASPSIKVPPELVEHCANPESVADQKMCLDPQLAELEVQLVNAVSQRNASLTGELLSAFQTQQSEWQRQRQFCGENENCLEAATQARLNVVASETPVQVAVAQEAAPAPVAQIVTLSPAPPALTAQQLGTVLNEPWMIVARSLVEVAQEDPSVLNSMGFLRAWYESAMTRGDRSQRFSNEFAGSVQNNAQQTIAATPSGPFLIGLNASNLYQNALVLPEGLKSRNWDRGIPLSRMPQNFTHLRVVSSSLYPTEVTTRFDLALVPVGQENAQLLQEGLSARTVSFNLVIEVTDIVPHGGGHNQLGSWATHFANAGSARLGFRGQVRLAGMYRSGGPQAQNQPPQFSPSQQLYAFAPIQNTPLEPGISTVAKRLGLSLNEEGKLVEVRQNNGCNSVASLATLMALRQAPPEEPSETQRALIYSCLATDFERDDFLKVSEQPDARDFRSLRFPQGVDEFRRVELLDLIDARLWRPMLSLVPQEPVDVVAVDSQVYLAEYDRARGGFPIQANQNSQNFARQGDFPALRSLPDFLPMSVDSARQLLAYLGNGTNRLQFVISYRLLTNGDAELTGLSLNGVTAQPNNAAQNLFGTKITEFDITPYKGELRPVASADAVAFWNELRRKPMATNKDLFYRALAIADDPTSIAEQVAAQDPSLENVHPFDRAKEVSRIAAEIVQEANSVEATDLFLEGQVEVSTAFEPGQKNFDMQRLTLRPRQADDFHQSGVAVQLQDPMVASKLPMDEATARLMFDFTDNYGSSYGAQSMAVIAQVRPVAVVPVNHGVTIMVEPVRLIVQSAQQSKTGYPVEYVELGEDDFESGATLFQPTLFPQAE